ncbi:DNA repair protein RecO [Candidatus Neptunichlamydia sp. REUL1]|uniref:DNA repair protein RecO n=1 Tax=Candidatus Neptunichlamydia sp. REUL1 TaxID=3064277 RepID=UPI00292E4D43|nr:DNA repair protein RecO [Candidatus Neptunochlamydia sp. REUL1]
MKDKRVEGVVLRATPYRENDRILTVLTPDRGVISLYVRRLSKSQPAILNLTTPLCRAEFVFKKGKTDLYRFLDGTIINLHLPLRRSYRHLEVAGKILQAILKTQMPGKDSYSLYLLLISFLKKLPEAVEPETFWATFQLKLLKHEGLLEIAENCLLCSSAPAMQILDGESRCSQCGGALGFPFKNEEWRILRNLFDTRSFDSLLALKLSPYLTSGIDACFQSAVML